MWQMVGILAELEMFWLMPILSLFPRERPGVRGLFRGKREKRVAQLLK
jgi:hypothetical protein